MEIRRARKEDSKMVAMHMMLAMEEIVYQIIGENSKTKATSFLESLIRQKNNSYSYENCWLMEAEGEIVAVANIYDGAKLRELNILVAQTLMADFNKQFALETETQAGEFYLDSLGVHPHWQGKGIGSKMLHFLIEKYVRKNHKTLGLLVDKDNPMAKKLYLRLGFEVVGEKILGGKPMEHLQIKK